MSGKERMQPPSMTPIRMGTAPAAMFANRDGKAAKNPDWRKAPRGPKRPEAKCRWRGRLTIPRHAHPLVRRLIVEMNGQDVTMDELAQESGVHVRTIRMWRSAKLPKLDLLDACFNVLGLRLAIEKVPD